MICKVSESIWGLSLTHFHISFNHTPTRCFSRVAECVRSPCQAASGGCCWLPAFPVRTAGPAAFSVLKKLPLEAWGLQQIKVMQKKLFKTKPGVINLKVCSKQMIEVTKASHGSEEKPTSCLQSLTQVYAKRLLFQSLVFLKNSLITHHLHN